MSKATTVLTLAAPMTPPSPWIRQRAVRVRLPKDRTTRPRHSRYVALMGSLSLVLVSYCCGSTRHSSMSALEARAAMPLNFHIGRFAGAGVVGGGEGASGGDCGDACGPSIWGVRVGVDAGTGLSVGSPVDGGSASGGNRSTSEMRLCLVCSCFSGAVGGSVVLGSAAFAAGSDAAVAVSCAVRTSARVLSSTLSSRPVSESNRRGSVRELDGGPTRPGLSAVLLGAGHARPRRPGSG